MLLKKIISTIKKKITSFLFSNFFIAVCAVALCIEAALQQQIPFNSLIFYVLIFSATKVFYTFAYTGEYFPNMQNRRAKWYAENNKIIIKSQYFFSAVMLACIMFYATKYFNYLFKIPIWQWLAEAAFAVIAILYYGVPFKKYHYINLRRTGWLKPFVIGFVWAGMVSFTPVLFNEVEQGKLYHFSMLNLLLFIKNFMYVSVLCILFDIKDYAADYNKKVKTFVVIHGLRKTIFYIIIPLCIIGFLCYVKFSISMNFTAIRIIFNCIPFILLLIVAWSMKKRKPILYYLAVIDGLMLLKALCGIAGMVL